MNKLKLKKENERLEHNTKVLDSLQIGDLIQFKRDLYSHWAVYIGHSKIIHLSGTNDDTHNIKVISGAMSATNLACKAIVKVDTYWSVTSNSYVYRNNSNDNQLIALPQEQIIMRAFSKVGFDYYSLIDFNCEHFAKWCRYNIPISDQANSILKFGNHVNTHLRLFKRLFNLKSTNQLEDTLLLEMTKKESTKRGDNEEEEEEDDDDDDDDDDEWQLVDKSEIILEMKSFLRQIHQVASSIVDTKYIPKHASPSQEEINQLNRFVSKSVRLFVISGAGLSTESGIPDYRSEGVGLYATSKSRPMEYMDFLKSEEKRRRYWARNYVGWPLWSSFKPNKSHLIMRDWEEKGKVYHHVTQNVDSLLTKAGCKRITELHGSSYRVACIDCGFKLTRDSMQLYIKSYNQQWNVHSTQLAPDADVQLTDEQIKGFKLPTCPSCNQNRLKPEIVFFGDSVPKQQVEFVYEKLSECDSLLVVGSSLQVYSAYRFVIYARDKLKIPIGIISIGQTRADSIANLKINTRCSEILNRIVI